MKYRCLFKLRTAAWIGALTTASLGFAKYEVDISYKTAGQEQISLDVHSPDTEGPHPVAILVHGGGWSSGDKRGADKPNSGADISPWFDAFTEAGFVWVSINYRLAPAHRWPACLDDTMDAIRWVKSHIADYGGDPARMVVVGHSAGGQLATLATLRLEDPTIVQAVIGCAAVTSFLQDLESRGGLSTSLQQLFDQPREPTEHSFALLREHSPLFNIPEGPLPPFLLIHGSEDKTVPLQQSLEFRTALLQRGASCDLFILPGAQHRLTEWNHFDPDWGSKMTQWARNVFPKSPTQSHAGELSPTQPRGCNPTSTSLPCP